MVGMVLSMGLPSAPWQPAQTWTFSSMLCACSGVAQVAKTAATATTPEMHEFDLRLIDRFRKDKSRPRQKKRGHDRSRFIVRWRPTRSVERERDNVVAAAEVDLGITTRADHNILLAAHHVGGRWRIDAGT